MENNKSKLSFKWLKDLLISGGLGVAVAILLVTFSFQLLHVPSKSMVPALEVGDRIVVTKFAYGWGKNSLPHLAYRLLGFLPEWSWFFSSPQRGDMVVFRPPHDKAVFYVKRIVGLPGDEIKLENNFLLINGEQLGYQPTPQDNITWQETNLNHQTYLVRMIPNFRDSSGPFIVPNGEYFVMGDNRPFSQDSRAPQVGTIPKKNIIGRVDLILYSLRDNLRGPLYFWDWSGFDKERFFKKVRYE